MKNFLITQGCTGTYSLIGAVGKHFNYGTNPSFNHHSRNANNDAFTEESRVVYLFCNPYTSLICKNFLSNNPIDSSYLS